MESKHFLLLLLHIANDLIGETMSWLFFFFKVGQFRENSMWSVRLVLLFMQQFVIVVVHCTTKYWLEKQKDMGGGQVM